MGDNPCVYFATILLCFGSCYYCSNLSLSLFYCNVVPSDASNRRLMLDLDFCAETDFYLSRIWAGFSVGNSEKSANLRVRYSDMYATFVSFEFSDLSNGSTSLKFVFTGCSVLADSVSVFCIVSCGL